ncbi:MAG: ribose 5-phosphate isomerase B [Oscillospiraceae bacterium]|jgi:ribose 5-phosphate isomerase B|nr:ribose 5-phosphate isomerase B [Oscillospiraceae bacterium]
MLVIGSDHAGYGMKLEIIKYLEGKQRPYLDVGGTAQSCDYPLIAVDACTKIITGECLKGILVCGTGIGMAIAANKVPGVRAAVGHDVYTVKLAREHNRINMLCLGARIIGREYAFELIEAFLNTEFELGRHRRRLDIITSIESKNWKTFKNNYDTVESPKDPEILKRR